MYHLYENQFSDDYNFSESPSRSNDLIIASTGRSGSHMLGHLLHRTGMFGFPLEYANPRNLGIWKKKLGTTTLPATIAELRKIRTSPNGVFGIKVQYNQIKQFGGFEGLRKIFPDAMYVMLSRSDVLDQAISMSIARQTGVFIEGQKPVGTDPEYSYRDIDCCMREAIMATAGWRYLLSSTDSAVLELIFEDILRDRRTAVERVATHLGIDGHAISLPDREPTQKQGDQRNREWRERFVAEHTVRGLRWRWPADLAMKLQRRLRAIRSRSTAAVQVRD